MNKILKAIIFILISYITVSLLISNVRVPYEDTIRKVLFVVILVTLVMLFDKKKLAYFGFRDPSKERLSLLLSLLGVFTIYVIFHGFSFSLTSPSLLPAVYIILCVSCEEVFFCGYSQNVLQESLRRIEAIILISLFFCIYVFTSQWIILVELFVLRLWLAFLFSLNLSLAPPLLGRIAYIMFSFF